MSVGPTATRTCQDCTADISHRGHRARRCEDCAATAIATSQRRASRKWRATRPGYIPQTPGARSCSCGADISHRGNRAVRCESCAEVARLENRREINRQYRARHPGLYIGAPSGWHRRGDPDRIAAYLRAYRRKHRERRREYNLAWRAANPEIIRRYRHEQWENRRDAQQRRRARKRSLPWEAIDYRVVVERDEGVCGLCRRPVDPGLVHPDPMSGSVDHVVPIAQGGPHLYENVQLAHLSCNMRKGDRCYA